MDENQGDPGRREDPIVLIGPIVRRVIAARATDLQAVDDLVQETLARVIEVRHRIDDRALVPYAIAVGRNLARSMHRVEERDRRSRVRLLEPQPTTPEEEALRRDEREAITAALARLDQREREALIDHEIRGIDVVALARRFASTPGAIAMRLARNRAKLRVEYLIEQSGRPATEICRVVLVALSSGDRRQQQRVDAAGLLRGCVYCSSLSPALIERRRLTALVPFAIGTGWLRKLRVPHETIPPALAPPSSTVAGVAVIAVVQLGRPALPCLGDVRPQVRVDEEVRICAMRVASVPADEGFWVIAGDSDRIWVLLTGAGESPFRVRAGQIGFRGPRCRP
jgi:RNA polymerase sigma factor (sigma-70 family)